MSESLFTRVDTARDGDEWVILYAREVPGGVEYAEQRFASDTLRTPEEVREDHE